MSQGLSQLQTAFSRENLETERVVPLSPLDILSILASSGSVGNFLHNLKEPKVTIKIAGKRDLCTLPTDSKTTQVVIKHGLNAVLADSTIVAALSSTPECLSFETIYLANAFALHPIAERFDGDFSAPVAGAVNLHFRVFKSPHGQDSLNAYFTAALQAVQGVDKATIIVPCASLVVPTAAVSLFKTLVEGSSRERTLSLVFRDFSTEKEAVKAWGENPRSFFRGLTLAMATDRSDSWEYKEGKRWVPYPLYVTNELEAGRDAVVGRCLGSVWETATVSKGKGAEVREGDKAEIRRCAHPRPFVWSIRRGGEWEALAEATQANLESSLQSALASIVGLDGVCDMATFKVEGGAVGADLRRSKEVSLPDPLLKALYRQCDSIWLYNLKQKWVPMSYSTSRRVEIAFSKGQPELEFEWNGQTYKIDFKSMTQYNLGTKKTRCLLRFPIVTCELLDRPSLLVSGDCQAADRVREAIDRVTTKTAAKKKFPRNLEDHFDFAKNILAVAFVADLSPSGDIQGIDLDSPLEYLQELSDAAVAKEVFA